MRLGIAIPAALAALIGGIFAWYSHVAGVSSNVLGGVMVAALLVMGWQPRAAIGLLIGGWVVIGINAEWGSRLPAGLSGEDMVVEATILTAQAQSDTTRLVLRVDNCLGPDQRPRCTALNKVRVTAYSDDVFTSGEQWRMTLRLRPPRGFANPATFDYGQWLWREGVHATGYLRQDPPPVLLASSGPSIRQLGLNYLAKQALDERTTRWLAALTLGDSEQLNQHDWSLLNATGTTHLVVISGLHVGLVASFVLMLARLGLAWPHPPTGECAPGHGGLRPSPVSVMPLWQEWHRLPCERR